MAGGERQDRLIATMRLAIEQRVLRIDRLVLAFLGRCVGIDVVDLWIADGSAA
jgi:hypothetical protein